MLHTYLIAAVITVVWGGSPAAQTTDDTWRAEFDRGQDAYDEARFVDAYDIWLPLAENGICKAEFAMGRIFGDFDREYTSATSDQIRVLTSRLQADTLRIGLPHYYGFSDSIYSNSHSRAEFAAIYWFQRAAINGHPDAPYMAAVMLLGRFFPFHGIESPDSSTLLVRFWFTVGAERGDERAMLQLARWRADPDAATFWMLVLERKLGHETAIGRFKFGAESLIPVERYEYLKRLANEWEPRSPIDSTPDDCL